MTQPNYTWTSDIGKTADELYHDEVACRQDIRHVNTPVIPGQIGIGGGPDIRENTEFNKTNRRMFEECMRSKSWKKKPL